MLPFPPILRRLVPVGVALACAQPAAAQLAANSPFLPPQSSAAAAPNQNAPLEYAGYLTTSEGTLYVLRDPAKKSSFFLKLNERDPTTGAVVKQHDGEQNTVTVEHQGRSLSLELRKAKIVSSGNPAMMAMPMPQPIMPTVAPAVTQTVVPNPTPADEQKRLEAVAAEVARRRALREQASQQMGQGGTPPPGALAQPPPAAQPQPVPPVNYQPRGGPQNQVRGPDPRQQPR